MNYLFSNNATSFLAIGTGSSSAVLTVATGHGGRFPQPLGNGSNGFPVTIEDRRSGQLEICFCTVRNGDLLQVLRGQEDTVAQTFQAGATVSHRMTAGTLAGLQNLISGGGISIEAADARYVLKEGDTMSGTLAVQPALAPTHATTKDYVDNGVASLQGAIDTGLALKEPVITAGNPAMFWAGDKTWRTVPSGGGVDFVEATGDTMSGALVIAANDASLKLQANPSTTPSLLFQDQTVDRWAQGFSGAGADFYLTRTPNGGSATQVYTIARASGVLDFKVNPTVNGVPLTVGAGVGLVDVSDTAPGTPIDKQLWWQSNTGYLFLRYNDGNGPAQWVQVNSSGGSISEAPLDGQAYERKSGGWAVAAGGGGGGIGEAPTDGQAYVRRGSTAGWVVGTPEAPTDGQNYVRKSAAWVVETSGITQAAADARYVNITGGETLTGALTMPGLASTSYVNGVTGSFSGVQAPGTYVFTGNCTSGGGGGVLGYSGPSYGILGYNNNYSLYGNATCYANDYQGGSMNLSSTIQSVGGKGIFGGTTTTASSANCNITTGGALYRSTASTLAVKADVEPLWDAVGDAILRLKPIWHRYRINTNAPKHWGFYSFGAEEVAQIDPHFADYDHAQAFDAKGDMIFDWKEEEHPDPEDPTRTVMKLVPAGPKLAPEKTPQHINWHALTTALINLVQRQEKRIQALEAKHV